MPLQIIDETTPVLVIEVADGGQRMGINGSADASAALAVNGTVFIAGNSRFASQTIPSSAVNPSQNSVSIGSGGSATVTAGNNQISISDQSTEITAIDSSHFTISNGGAAATVRYTWW